MCMALNCLPDYTVYRRNGRMYLCCKMLPKWRRDSRVRPKGLAELTPTFKWLLTTYHCHDTGSPTMPITLNRLPCTAPWAARASVKPCPPFGGAAYGLKTANDRLLRLGGMTANRVLPSAPTPAPAPAGRKSPHRAATGAQQGTILHEVQATGTSPSGLPPA